MHKDNDKLTDQINSDAKFFEDAKDNAIADKNRLRLELEAMECVADENDELKKENFALNKQADQNIEAFHGLKDCLEKYKCGNSVCKLKIMEIISKQQVKLKRQPQRKACLK